MSGSPNQKHKMKTKNTQTGAGKTAAREDKDEQMGMLGIEVFAKIARIQELAEDMPAPESGFVTWGSVADMGRLVDGLDNILAWLGGDEK